MANAPKAAIRKSPAILDAESHTFGPLSLNWNSESPPIMPTSRIIGILLIVLGVAAFAYQGIRYTTTEKAIDLGPIHVTAETEHTFPIPPLVGIAAVTGGLLLLISNRSNSPIRP